MSCSRHASTGHTHTTISNRAAWRDDAAAEAELTTLRGSCDAHYASLQRERERMTRAEHRIRALEMENKRLKDALTASFAAETSNKHRRAAEGGDQNSSSPLGVTVTVRQYAQLLDVARRYQQTLRDLAALQKTLTRRSSNNNNGGGGSGAVGINADARFTAFPITIPDLPPNALGVKQDDSVVRRMSSSAKPSSSCDTQRPSFKMSPPPPPAAMDDSPTWGDVVSDTTMSDGDCYDWGSSDGIATSPQPHALRRSLVSPPAAPSSPPPRGDVGQQSRMLQSPLLDGDANARLIEFDDGVGSGKGLRASEQHSVAPLVVTISDTDTTRKIQEEEKEKEKEKEEEEAAWQGPMHRHSGKFAIPLPPPVARPFGSGKPTDSEVDSQIDRTDQLTLDLVRELSALSAALPESAPKRIAAVCEKRGLDYVDVSFPPVTASLGVGGCRGLDLRRQQGFVVRWHSSSAYMAALGGNPSSVQLLSSAAAVDPCALRVGQLGDRGVVAALAALAEAAGAITSMLASTTTEDERNGVYSVWLSQHGLWTLVHVDAFLPCVEMDVRDGGCKQPQQQLALYGCSNALAGGDLWGAVSEKALAKTCGSYRALFALHASDAVGHFTGGPVECWEWWQRRPDIAFEEIEAVINTTARGSGMVLLTTYARPIVKSKGSHQQHEDGRDDEVFSALAACNLSPGTTYRALSVTVSPEGDAMLLLRNWERHGSGDSCQDNRQLAPLHAEARNTESCLWLNYKTEVQRYFKQCHVCFDCRRYHDVRIPILFSANRPAIPQYLCRITVLPNAESEPARLWIGLHQPPPGGHHGGGGGWRPEIKISLIGHDESRPSTNCVLSESYGGMYQAAMPAVWMYMELDASPDSSTMFYVLPRVRWSSASSSAAAEDGPLEAAPRTAVLALLAEKRESVSVELLTSPAELTAALYLDVVEQLDLSLCSAAHSPTPFQTNGQQTIPEAVFAW